jgi:predicted AlkP superfamily pyrophosphatase or phosphodiesterase
MVSSCESEQEPAPVVEGIKHIIIIGVDGMTPDGIRNSDSPNIHHLMDIGVSTMHGRAVLPTISSPNWASMIMGVGPEQHGITSNSWERDDFVLPAVDVGKDNIFPTVFALIRENLPTAEMGVIYQWDGFVRLFEGSAVSWSANATDEQDATDKTVIYIREKKPLFTFVQLDHVDGAGHHYGYGSPQYYAAVGRADELIGQIIDAVKRAGIYNETVFIVTADHGGIGKGHGGETLAEVEIPFIISGKDIKKNQELTTSFVQYDNAATVAFALNIARPSRWTGRPAKSAFEGFNDDDAAE